MTLSYTHFFKKQKPKNLVCVKEKLDLRKSSFLRSPGNSQAFSRWQVQLKLVCEGW